MPHVVCRPRIHGFRAASGKRRRRSPERPQSGPPKNMPSRRHSSLLPSNATSLVFVRVSEVNRFHRARWQMTATRKQVCKAHIEDRLHIKSVGRIETQLCSIEPICSLLINIENKASIMGEIRRAGKGNPAAIDQQWANGSGNISRISTALRRLSRDSGERQAIAWPKG